MVRLPEGLKYPFISTKIKAVGARPLPLLSVLGAKNKVLEGFLLGVRFSLCLTKIKGTLKDYRLLVYILPLLLFRCCPVRLVWCFHLVRVF